LRILIPYTDEDPQRRSAREGAGPDHIARAYGQAMANKAPPSGQNKKQGKSLKEKRAAKKAKKDEKSKHGLGQ
jgi:hypothetical protein